MNPPRMRIEFDQLLVKWSFSHNSKRIYSSEFPVIGVHARCDSVRVLGEGFGVIWDDEPQDGLELLQVDSGPDRVNQLWRAGTIR